MIYPRFCFVCVCFVDVAIAVVVIVFIVGVISTFFVNLTSVNSQIIIWLEWGIEITKNRLKNRII